MSERAIVGDSERDRLRGQEGDEDEDVENPHSGNRDGEYWRPDRCGHRDMALASGDSRSVHPHAARGGGGSACSVLQLASAIYAPDPR